MLKSLGLRTALVAIQNVELGEQSLLETPAPLWHQSLPSWILRLVSLPPCCNAIAEGFIRSEVGFYPRWILHMEWILRMGFTRVWAHNLSQVEQRRVACSINPRVQVAGMAGWSCSPSLSKHSKKEALPYPLELLPAPGSSSTFSVCVSDSSRVSLMFSELWATPSWSASSSVACPSQTQPFLGDPLR